MSIDSRIAALVPEITEWRQLAETQLISVVESVAAAHGSTS